MVEMTYGGVKRDTGGLQNCEDFLLITRSVLFVENFIHPSLVKSSNLSKEHSSLLGFISHAT